MADREPPLPAERHGQQGVRLARDEEGLYLLGADGTAVRAATANLIRPRRGRDLLRRAVGDVRPKGERDAEAAGEIVDATAGLGADAFHLARLGLRVTLVERAPLVAALLRDALEVAAEGRWGGEAQAAQERLKLVEGDAREYLLERSRAGHPPVVVLIDPMYPRSGKAALPAKGMALFRDLVGSDDDAQELLAAALATAVRRVVVKRPRKAPYLGGLRPSGSLEGSTTRYDLYAPTPSG